MKKFTYRGTYTGAAKYFRIDEPSTGKVMLAVTGALVAAALVIDNTYTQAETSNAITFNVGLRGYVVTIPTALVAGDYDITFYAAAAADAAASDPVENGFRFRWTGTNMITPFEKLSDGVL